MRKIFFLSIIILFWASGCSIVSEIKDDEEVEISLPVWPPEDSFSAEYPALSRWVIIISGADFQDSFSTQNTTVKVHVKKNSPFSVLAHPITLLENGKECNFFKPAGFLYPWSLENSNCATWEQGFLADIMHCLFLNGKDNYIPSGDIAWLTSTFNWKKAQETIEKKIAESQIITDSEESDASDRSGEAEKKFYNPWLIPIAPILENISVSQFKSSLLNLTGCYAVSTSISPLFSADSRPQTFSSFIPENRTLPYTNQFTVRKGNPLLVSSAKNYGIIITYESTKKISLEVVILPIFIKEI